MQETLRISKIKKNNIPVPFPVSLFAQRTYLLIVIHKNFFMAPFIYKRNKR